MYTWHAWDVAISVGSRHAVNSRKPNRRNQARVVRIRDLWGKNAELNFTSYEVVMAVKELLSFVNPRVFSVFLLRCLIEANICIYRSTWLRNLENEYCITLKTKALKRSGLRGSILFPRTHCLDSMFAQMHVIKWEPHHLYLKQKDGDSG